MLRRFLLAVFVWSMTCTLAFGDPLTIPNTFTSGTTIQSSQMNANFTSIGTWAAGLIANDNIKANAGIAPSKLGSTSAYPLLLLAAGTTGFSIGNTGDTQPRFAFDSDGKLKFGPGGATAQDVMLKRSSSTKFAFRNAADNANVDLDVDDLTATGAVAATGAITGASIGLTNGNTATITPAAMAAGRAITLVDPLGASSLRTTTGAFAAGGIAYTDGTNILSSAAGTAGQIVASGGTGAPVYVAAWGLHPGHRLTLETGVPVSSTTQSAKGTIYFTPYQHNRAWLKYNGQWRPYEIDEISLALVATSGSAYAVYLYATSETAAALETQAWTNTTTRATAIATDADTGLPIKSGDATRVHVGDFYATGTDQTSIDNAYLGVWNRFNKVELFARASDTTASYTYASTTNRAANSNTTNGQGRIGVFRGDDTIPIEAYFSRHCTASGSYTAQFGIGIDSTTVNSAQAANFYAYAAGIQAPVWARYCGRPGVGLRQIQALENSVDSTNTIYGDTSAHSGGTGNKGPGGLVVKIVGWEPKPAHAIYGSKEDLCLAA